MTTRIESAADVHRLVKPVYRVAAITAIQQGWRLSLTGGGHLRWTPPGDESTVFTPSTPSDYRGVLNCMAQLRRAGLRFPS